MATLERLLKQGKIVYVHCIAGVNRSPTVVAAYLHWCLELELVQVLSHLHACRDYLPDADAIHSARRSGALDRDDGCARLSDQDRISTIHREGPIRSAGLHPV
jgi:hypothetical protein